MAKWNVTASIAGSKYLGTYEAKTGKEAIEMAAENASASLCHACSREVEDAEVQFCIATNDTTGKEVTDRDEPNWEGKAIAAGWRPPAKKKARK